jgi:glycosyltransferase involved in cell wall biosynthesis
MRRPGGNRRHAPRCRRIRRRPDDFVLLFPGMLLPAKGQGGPGERLPELCRALPRLRVWFVAGEADLAYGRRLRERTAALTAAGRVRWLGWRDDLPGLMAAADAILTLPQGEEGFGLPLIEAMAAGRPVLSSALGPAREILPASEFPGCLVPAAGGAALAAALEGLAADPERRARLGGGGARVVAHYTLAGMVEAFGPGESTALTSPVVLPKIDAPTVY